MANIFQPTFYDSNSSIHDRWKFAIIVFLWACLRLPGLDSAIFQDEVHILRAVSHFVSERTIIPPWFDWSPLFAYLAVPATGAISVIGGWQAGTSPAEWAQLQAELVSQDLVLGNRLLSLVFSLAVLWMLWSQFGRDASPLRRFVLCLGYLLSPVAIQYAAYGLPEEAMALGVTATLALAFRYAESGRLKLLVAAGVCAGVAGAFKYNGVFSVGAIIAATWIACPGERPFAERFRHLALAGCACVGTFLLLTPTWWLVPGEAMGGVLWESGFVATPRMGPNNSGHLAVLGFLATHEPGWILAVTGAVWVILRRKSKAVAERAAEISPLGVKILTLPLAVMALNWVFVGGWVRMDPNYWYPSIPAMSVALGWGLAMAMREWTLWRSLNVIVLILFAAIIWARLSPLGRGENNVPAFGRDSRDLMRETLAENLSPNALIFRDGAYTPKVWSDDNPPPENAPEDAILPRARKVIVLDQWRLEPGHEDLDAAIPVGSVLLTSSLVVNRVREYPPPDHPALAAEHAQKLALYKALFDPEGTWELLAEIRTGSGQTQYAFQKIRDHRSE